MIDESRAFRNLLKEWGHDVLLQRQLPNGNHSAELERVTTRQRGQGGMENANSMKVRDEGIWADYDAVYYFEANVTPKQGDRIYEDYSTKSHKNYSMFMIQAVSANRGRHGKVVFWTVGSKREK